MTLKGILMGYVTYIEPEIGKLLDLLDTAWGIIANAGWYGEPKTSGWQEAAERWRDDYFKIL